MALTTPFLDLESRLFGFDQEALGRMTSRFVLATTGSLPRQRAPTHPYGVAIARPPGTSAGATTIVRSNDAALALAHRRPSAA